MFYIQSFTRGKHFIEQWGVYVCTIQDIGWSASLTWPVQSDIFKIDFEDCFAALNVGLVHLNLTVKPEIQRQTKISDLSLEFGMSLLTHTYIHTYRHHIISADMHSVCSS